MNTINTTASKGFRVSTNKYSTCYQIGHGREECGMVIIPGQEILLRHLCVLAASVWCVVTVYDPPPPVVRCWLGRGSLCTHEPGSDARRRCHHQGTGNTTLTNAVIYAESRLYTCDYQWYFRYFSLLFSQCPGRRGARAGCQDRVSSANTESELPTFQTDTQQPTHQPITFLKLQIMVFIETDNFVSEGVRNLILIIQFYSIHSLLLNILPLPQS